MRKTAGYIALLAGLMLGMALTEGAFASTATSPILGHAPTMLVVTENAAAGKTSVTASQSLVVSGAGVQSPGLSRIALLTQQSATLAVVPSMSASASRYASNQDAANAVGFYVQSFAGQISRAVVGAMRSLNSQPIGAMFSFIQNVKIAGKQAQAIASEWVRPDGSYDYLGVKVSNTNSSILFAVYTEGEIAGGLPSNWSLPNPGALIWGVASIHVDPATGQSAMTMEAVSGSVWHTQSFLKNGGPLGQYGLYDAPQVATVSKQQVILNCQIDPATHVCSRYAPGQSTPNRNNAKFDPDTGLRALISAQIRPLMNRYNVNSAFVTYGRTVKPVYLPPDASGVRKAVLAVDVTSRKAQLPSCFTNGGTAIFTNSGSIGWMLDYSFDEYLVQPNGSFTKIGNVDKHKISPTKIYHVQGTTTIPAGVSATSVLANDVVDPWGSGAVYSIYRDTVHGLPASDYIPSPLPTVSASYKNAGLVNTNLPGYGSVKANVCTGQLIVNGGYVAVRPGTTGPMGIKLSGNFASHFAFWFPAKGWNPYITTYSRRAGVHRWERGGVVKTGTKINPPGITETISIPTSKCNSWGYGRRERRGRRVFRKRVCTGYAAIKKTYTTTAPTIQTTERSWHRYSWYN